MQNRRYFLKSSLAFLALGNFSFPVISSGNEIMTVTGKITAAQLGLTLPHEHVFSNFGAPITDTPAFDEEKLMAQVLPYLKHIKSLGCETIVDCTGAYFGRAPQLLKKLSEASGVQILTNTGYYGAADDRYIPEHAYQETAGQLANRWIKEWEQGIDGTGIRPGFIKLAVDSGPLSEIDAKLIRAGAITHRHTGLTMAVHTGNNQQAALAQLKILEEEKVHPSAWIWVHANKAENAEALLPLAEKGAWISLDGLREEASLQKHLEILKVFKKEGYLPQLLLSHDGNSFPRGGNIRPYEALFTKMIPAMKNEEFTQSEIQQLTIENPARAFSIKIRKI